MSRNNVGRASRPAADLQVGLRAPEAGRSVRPIISAYPFSTTSGVLKTHLDPFSVGRSLCKTVVVAPLQRKHRPRLSPHPQAASQCVIRRQTQQSWPQKDDDLVAIDVLIVLANQRSETRDLRQS